MRLLKDAAGHVLSMILLTGILLTSNGSLQAQTTYPGTVGYEESGVTVNYSDMVQYEATHPETGIKNPLNPLKHSNVPESEFRHGDLNVNKVNSSPDLSKSLTHRMKSNNLPSPTPDTTFEGIASNGNDIPPDTYSAIGPNQVMITTNSDVKLTSKTGTQLATPVSLTSFWSAVGGSLSCFDPKCVYDPYSDRFIVTALSLDITNNSNSYLLVGASATNNPTGAWHLFKIVIDATNQTWLDYPELGFNKNWIVVNGNLFSSSPSNFMNADVFIFNKANILAGTNAQHTLINNLTNDFSVCPLFTFDSTINDMYCAEAYNGTSAAISLFKITGTPTLPLFSLITTLNGAIPWASSINTTGADAGPQTGTAHKIDLDDDRISSGVYRNHSIWFSHNAYLPASAPTRCSIEWWQVDTLGNIIQNGLIDDPTSIDTFFVYPSIAVNQANDVVVGYSMLASNMYPSAAYSYRAASDSLSTMRLPYIFKHGTTYYYQTLAGPNNRYGDYSSTSVDPSDNQTFYTHQEYPFNTTTWATWIAKIYQCNVAPSAPVLGPNSACNTGTTTFYVNPVPYATSYTWTVSGTGWSGSSTTDSIAVTAGSGNGIIKVIVNNPCGASIADSVIINSAASPITIAPASITYTPPLCQGTTVYFYATPINGITDYRWGIVSGTGWAGTSIVDSIGLFVGSVPLTVAVAGVNGCGAGPNDTLIVMPAPLYTSTFSLSNVTPIQTQVITVTYTGNAPSSATYNWSFGTSGTGTPGNPFQGPQSVSWTAIGVKHITLTVVDSGCASSQSSHVATVGASGINEINATPLDIQVYPNPSDGNFNLNFKDIKHGELNIQLIDILGQIVYNEDIMPATSTFSKTLAVSKLPAGIYWINIKGNDTYFTDKIIIK